jgi:hypothetical protein
MNADSIKAAIRDIAIYAEQHLILLERIERLIEDQNAMLEDIGEEVDGDTGTTEGPGGPTDRSDSPA